MFRDYKDTRIMRNLKIVKVLSLISLILWGVCIFTYLFTKLYQYNWVISHPRNLTLSYISLFWGGEEFWKKIFDESGKAIKYEFFDNPLFDQIIWDIIYCLAYFEFADFTYSFSKTAVRKAETLKQSNEDKATSKKATAAKDRINQRAEEFIVDSKQNNDLKNTLTYIIVNFIPVAVFVLLLLSTVIASIAGTYEDIYYGVCSVSYHLGYMLPSHIFLVISSGFLIQNRVLIKREWKTNPPPFLLKEQLIAQKEAQKKKAEQDIATCKELLEQCGMRFFIEYYPQLKRLPIPDINVSNHYFPERQVSLTAAKKIIDTGLTECALRYIIENYGDAFSGEFIDRAKSILSEIEIKKDLQIKVK